MTALITASAAALTVLVLLAGAAGHLFGPAVLGDALRAHGTVPSRLVGPLTLAVPLAEGAVALAGAFALAGGWAQGLRLAMAGAAALLACYAGYAFHVSRTRSGVPCGCSSGGTPMNGWIAVRATALGLLAAAAAAGAGAATPVGGDRLATVLLAGAVFGALLWEMPAMMTRGGAR